MDFIDYIKINFQSISGGTLKNVVDLAHSMNKKCIATNVDTEELHRQAISLGVDAMEGSYVARQMATKAHSSGYLQSNFFRLMVAVVKEEPDME